MDNSMEIQYIYYKDIVLWCIIDYNMVIRSELRILLGRK